MNTTENSEYSRTPQNNIERAAGAGFSDWQRAAKSLGQKSLTFLIDKMDPGDTVSGVNSHHVIANRLRQLDLPIHTFVTPRISEFLSNPQTYLDQIPGGDYYFVSIQPGLHLAHCLDPQAVIDFVESHRHDVPTDKEIYVSHNGEPVMSGHIIVEADGEPNSIFAEFTNDNFNAFHRGHHAPEISLRRERNRFKWDFHGSLGTKGGWRDDTVYSCNGGVALTRTEMALRIYDAVSRIPRDGDIYRPGYYEVLLEKVGDSQTKPIFIEAI